MPDSFATSEELATFLNQTFESGAEAQADLLLEMASTAIKSAAGQTLALVEDDEVLLAGTWASDLELPERPVVDVTAVAVNGVPVSPGDFQWNERQLLRRSRVLDELTGSGFGHHAPGARWGYPGHWGGPGSTVAVTYSHGFDPIPDDLHDLCLELVGQQLVVPAGIRSQSIGSWSESYFDTGGLSITLTLDQKRRISERYGYR